MELDLQLSSEKVSGENLSLPAIRILVADEDPVTRRVSAEAHGSGMDYDLILLDWKMPGMNCHLSKPLDIQLMIREIRRHLLPEPTEAN